MSNPVKMRGLAMLEIWESRTVILSAFGLVGFGALLGAGTVYYFYIKNKIEERFLLHSTVMTKQIRQLRQDVDEIRDTISSKKSKALRKKESRAAVEQRRAQLATTDNEEFITATSEEEEGEESETGFLSPQGEGDEDEESAVNDFFARVDKLLDGNAAQQLEGFNMLKSNKEKLKSYSGFWYRFASATYYQAAVAEENGDKELRKTLVFTAFTHAEKALQMDEFNAQTHKWFAICAGTKGEFMGINERIQNGFIFKEHIDRGISLNPKDPSLHYLLGRFCFEVSQLSWVEKKVAATLFSSPPTSTPKEALDHFMASESLGNPSKETRLYIGKCYIALKDPKQAAIWLKSGIDLPITNPSDKTAHQLLTQLYAKYKSYA